jgi:hypothetical protein
MAGFGYKAQAFKDMWIATRTRFEKKVLNTLQREHPLLDKISGKGNFQAKEGGAGKRNVETILTKNNNQIQYVGFRDTIHAEEINLLEQIEWDWKFMYNSFTVYDKVLEMSRTDELVNLLEQYQEATRKGFQEHLAKQIYAYGGETKPAGEPDKQALEIGGLRYLISDNPYGWIYANDTDWKGLPNGGQQVVFNLRRDGAPGDRNYVNATGSQDYSMYTTRREWWRNRIAAFINNFPDNTDANTRAADIKLLVDTMRRMRRVLSNGDSGLDGIYCSYDFYELYLEYLDSKRTFYVERRSPDKMDAAYSSLEFDGLPIYADKYCPPGRMYFLNSNYLHFKYLEGQNFKQEIRQVPDQWAKRYITTFIGNLIVTRPHTMGVIYRGGGEKGNPIPMNLAVWTGLFTNATATGYNNFCRYNMALWNKFIDWDYDWVKPIAAKQYTETLENTGFSGSGVFMGDSIITR